MQLVSFCCLIRRNDTQGHKKTISLGFELYGGFILQHPVTSPVLAAAVVEMDHYRELKNSADDHQCAIIHYHLPFNEHLPALWNLMANHMKEASLICWTKYIYYAKVNKVGLTLNQKLISQQDKFLGDYKFDVDNRTCHFDGGQFVAAPGFQMSDRATPQISFLDIAARKVKGLYSPTILINLPIHKATITLHE